MFSEELLDELTSSKPEHRYLIGPNFLLVEKHLKKNLGYYYKLDRVAVMEVRAPLSNAEKVVVVLHELVHHVQREAVAINDRHITKKAKADKQEKLAQQVETVFINLLSLYPAFREGLIDILRMDEKHRAKLKRL